MDQTLHLIYNPAAGSLSERKALKAAREMGRLGYHIELLPTSGPGSATELARMAVAAGAKRIVVAGGDGTINEAINGFAPSQTELAIIPAGTANVLAIELGIPFNAADASRIAAKGYASPIDLGLAGERAFTLMAGIGFDAMAVKNLSPLLKKTIRHAAFPVAGLKAFIQEELPLLRVTSGDRMAAGYFAVVSNSHNYGGRFGPSPEASITDGLLDICVLKENSFPNMVNFWIRSLARSRLPADRAEYFRAAELEVTCPGGENVLVQTDGDLIGELPMKFSVMPGGLKVCRGNL
ncbi:MAG: diacylglycerol/lipid kinase family protein [Thermoleophilia bacterium]